MLKCTLDISSKNIFSGYEYHWDNCWHNCDASIGSAKWRDMDSYQYIHHIHHAVWWAYSCKGPFTPRDSLCDNVNFFLKQVMGYVATNEFVHCVSDFYCEIDLNGEVIFDTVAASLCELTLKLIICLLFRTLFGKSLAYICF